MAKKSTRGRRKRQVSQERVEQKPTPVAEATASSAAADLADEYSYVFADLRKIGLIAAAMFVLLFALAFVLR
jgi:uncharacterized protein YhjY with autotransporter beta-barrel domain